MSASGHEILYTATLKGHFRKKISLLAYMGNKYRAALLWQEEVKLLSSDCVPTVYVIKVTEF